jgi:hypothetical protein
VSQNATEAVEHAKFIGLALAKRAGETRRRVTGAVHLNYEPDLESGFT